MMSKHEPFQPGAQVKVEFYGGPADGKQMVVIANDEGRLIARYDEYYGDPTKPGPPEVKEIQPHLYTLGDSGKMIYRGIRYQE